MSVWEILLIVFCALFVFTVGVVYVINRKKGKTCCDCAHCKRKCDCEKYKEDK